MTKKIKLEELREITHEQLCNLLDEGQIDWSTWIDAQSETYPDYGSWLNAKGLHRNDENAQRYLDYMEEKTAVEDKEFFHATDATVE